MRWGSLTTSLVEKLSSKLSEIYCSQDVRERTTEEEDSCCPLSSLKHIHTYSMCVYTHIHAHIQKTLQLILFEYEIKMVNNVGFSVKTQLLSSFFHVY